MRKVFYAPWPHDDDVVAQATALGCVEILDGEGGYTEIAEPLDDIDNARADAKARLAAIRWERSRSMSYTPNGGTVTVPVDIEAGTNVVGAIIGLQLAGSTGPITWKFGDHFLPMTLPQLVALGQAMRSHVQACFDNESAIALLIDEASTAAEALAVDLQAGWPA